MKRRTICLLLAGLMTASLLSGCGGKTANQPNTPDHPDTESTPAEETQAPEESVAPLSNARDPRWDELQPGETAVQYYDIFIKSGMTVGEAVEAVESSKVYQEQEIGWGFSSREYQGLDQELTGEALGEVKTSFTDTGKIVTEQGLYTNDESITVTLRNRTIMNICFFENIPGMEGATYRVRDLPVFLVCVGQVKNEISHCDEAHTVMGTVGEIRAMDYKTLEHTLTTVFQERDPDCEIRARENRGELSCFSRLYFSWNGCSIWTCESSVEDEKDPAKGFRTSSSFLYQYGDNNTLRESWVLDNTQTAQFVGYYWVKD